MKKGLTKIFLREKIVAELDGLIKEYKQTHPNTKQLLNYLFKNSPRLIYKLKTRHKDFRKLKDIYYIFYIEMKEIFDIEISYYSFRNLFYEYIGKK